MPQTDVKSESCRCTYSLTDHSFGTLYAGTFGDRGRRVPWLQRRKRSFSYIAVVPSRLLWQPVLVLPVGEQRIEINLRASIHPAAAIVRAHTAEFYIFQIVGIFTCDSIPDVVWGLIIRVVRCIFDIGELGPGNPFSFEVAGLSAVRSEEHTSEL